MKFKQLLAITSCAIAFGTTAPAEETVDVSTVLATVNDSEITVGHVIALVSKLPDQYQSIPDETLFQGVLDQLIQQSAIGAEADNESLSMKLALDNEVRALQAAEVLDTASKAAVTEEAIKSAYEERYASAEPVTEYKASHILVDTEAEARGLVESLVEGADFAELAKEKSTGPSGPSGGDLGWFTPDRMVPEFSEAVVKLETGSISAPIQTQFGWHVVKLYETRPLPTPALEEVREELFQELNAEAINSAIERLEKAATITRAEVEVDPSVIRRVDLLD